MSILQSVFPDRSKPVEVAQINGGLVVRFVCAGHSTSSVHLENLEHLDALIADLVFAQFQLSKAHESA